MIPISRDMQFSVRKVLRKKNNRSLVVFDGLPDSFTEWIPSNEVDKLFKPLLKYSNT